ncbi:hypothetical protein T08_14303 [Trichinella sp. T8]|nr:hypothetical protein T08_14303 [Trichinella sp. T8]
MKLILTVCMFFKLSLSSAYKKFDNIFSGMQWVNIYFTSLKSTDVNALQMDFCLMVQLSKIWSSFIKMLTYAIKISYHSNLLNLALHLVSAHCIEN